MMHTNIRAIQERTLQLYSGFTLEAEIATVIAQRFDDADPGPTGPLIKQLSIGLTPWIEQHP